ncbi:hypothetical protein [Dokdonella sp.]|uniref:hypothetical protein n=1 Tax=Dokdonella sp. TaxID=2291710 RepID=UPI00262C89C6|nr:hypothetical protein [Dokdonella sp.]
MEQTRELDELKSAWQALGRQLEQQNALRLHELQGRHGARARRHLRPLAVGQAIQMLVGAIALLLLLPFWTGAGWTGASWLTACGLVVHVYCIGLIAFGGFMQARIARIDPAEPVLVLQQRLATLRRDYAVGGLLIGLPWWFLAAPLLVVLTRGAILDTAPSVIGIQLAVGGAGLLATAGFHRWAHDPRRPHLARRLDDAMTGASLRRARAELDAIARFGRE